mgnify:CR=1 FL=1
MMLGWSIIFIILISFRRAALNYFSFLTLFLELVLEAFNVVLSKVLTANESPVCKWVDMRTFANVPFPITFWFLYVLLKPDRTATFDIFLPQVSNVSISLAYKMEYVLFWQNIKQKHWNVPKMFGSSLLFSFSNLIPLKNNSLWGVSAFES